MIRYHTFTTEVDAIAKLSAIRAAGGLAYMLTMNAKHYEVREIR